MKTKNIEFEREVVDYIYLSEGAEVAKELEGLFITASQEIVDESVAAHVLELSGISSTMLSNEIVKQHHIEYGRNFIARRIKYIVEVNDESIK